MFARFSVQMFHCTQFPFSIFKLKKEGMAQDFCTLLYNIPLYFDNPWLIKNKKKLLFIVGTTTEEKSFCKKCVLCLG